MWETSFVLQVLRNKAARCSSKPKARKAVMSFPHPGESSLCRYCNALPGAVGVLLIQCGGSSPPVLGLELQCITYPQDSNPRSYCLYVRWARRRSMEDVRRMMAPAETVEEALERLRKKVCFIPSRTFHKHHRLLSSFVLRYVPPLLALFP